VRTAVEMFVAAQAPAGFFGNSYSSFSRGVGMLRASSSCTVGTCGNRHSFAYDCAAKFEAAAVWGDGVNALEVAEPMGCSSENALRVRGKLGSIEGARVYLIHAGRTRPKLPAR